MSVASPAAVSRPVWLRLADGAPLLLEQVHLPAERCRGEPHFEETTSVDLHPFEICSTAVLRRGHEMNLV